MCLCFLQFVSCNWYLILTALWSEKKAWYNFSFLNFTTAWFLSGWSVRGISGLLVSHYYCVAVDVPFYSCYHLPYVLRLLCWVHVYIHNCSIFLGSSLCIDHYVVSFFVSWNSLYFNVYFIWCECCYSNFHLRGISFSSPSLSVCMCPLTWSGFLVDSSLGAHGIKRSLWQWSLGSLAAPGFFPPVGFNLSLLADYLAVGILYISIVHGNADDHSTC